MHRWMLKIKGDRNFYYLTSLKRPVFSSYARKDHVFNQFICTETLLNKEIQIQIALNIKIRKYCKK